MTPNPTLGPQQLVQVAMTILQVIATFALIWAATAGYLFKELEELRTAKIRERTAKIRGIENPENEPRGQVSRWILYLAAAAVSGGGVLMFVLASISIWVVARFVGWALTSALYLIAALIGLAVLFVILIVRQIAGELEEDGIREVDGLKRDFERGTVGLTILGFLFVVVFFLLS